MKTPLFFLPRSFLSRALTDDAGLLRSEWQRRRQGRPLGQRWLRLKGGLEGSRRGFSPESLRQESPHENKFHVSKGDHRGCTRSRSHGQETWRPARRFPCSELHVSWHSQRECWGIGDHIWCGRTSLQPGQCWTPLYTVWWKTYTTNFMALWITVQSIANWCLRFRTMGR